MRRSAKVKLFAIDIFGCIELHKIIAEKPYGGIEQTSAYRHNSELHVVESTYIFHDPICEQKGNWNSLILHRYFYVFQCAQLVYTVHIFAKFQEKRFYSVCLFRPNIRFDWNELGNAIKTNQKNLLWYLFHVDSYRKFIYFVIQLCFLCI